MSVLDPASSPTPSPDRTQRRAAIGAEATDRRLSASPFASALLGLLVGRVTTFVAATASLFVVKRSLSEDSASDFFVLLLLHGLLSTFVLAGLGTKLVPVLAMHFAQEHRTDPPSIATSVFARATRRALVAACVFAVAAPRITGVGSTSSPAIALLLLPTLLYTSSKLALGATRELAGIEVTGRVASCALIVALAVSDLASTTSCLLAWTMPPVMAPWIARRAIDATVLRAFDRGVRRAFLRSRRRATLDDASRLDFASLDRTTRGDLVRAFYLLGTPLAVGISVGGVTSGAAFADFGFAHRLFTIAAVVPATISTTLAGPLGLVDHARVRTRQVVATLLVVGVVTGLGLGLACTLFDATGRASALAWIFASAMPALCIAAVAIPYLIAHEREASVLRISVIGLVATAVATLTLQLMFGLAGAAWGIVTGEIVVAIAAGRAASDTLREARTPS
ncbi:MAG: polysaccharide biosynthesis protein [Planctomycetes bacterium]|nr:polysaccharide biosynthesis protein [Planctomycetota bacterium]